MSLFPFSPNLLFFIPSVCQATQTAPPPPPPPPPPAPEQQTTPPPGSPAGGAGSPGGLGPESLSPEFFTSVVQGVLSSLLGSLGARAGSSESIAAFIQRLSGSSNIFEPGADGALGEQMGGALAFFQKGQPGGGRRPVFRGVAKVG